MKKLIYISFIFAFLLAFASCEKEEILPFNDNDEYSTRGGDNIIIDAREITDESGDRGGDDDKGDDLITDPDEDEDFDEDENIVDPDEDEDFEEEEGGK